jgi:dethiobiotin synthetase
VTASSQSGLFITGTDTGVGKTLVTCAILRNLRQSKIDAVGFKPSVTGAVDGKWEDAEAIHAASDRCEPLELLCPLRFNQPLAPTLAAFHDRRSPDLAPARAALSELKHRHAMIVVEGVGGALVPLDEKTLVLDFAVECRYPLVLVCRAALGTINHTLLTLREIERAGLTLAGIVMNTTRESDAERAEETRREIERVGGKKIVAVLPYFSKDAVNGASGHLHKLTACATPSA